MRKAAVVVLADTHTGGATRMADASEGRPRPGDDLSTAFGSAHAFAVITIGIDPTIEPGPLTLAWHGITIALGIIVGGLVAAREAKRRGLDTQPLETMAALLAVGAVVGARVFYLVEHGLILEPGAWLATTGFTFYGGLIGAAVAVGVYLRRRRLSLTYVDAIAFAVPVGIAVGRIGDVINGEHYGPATDFLLGVRNTHPEALTPSPGLAYHSGGLYEVLLGILVFAVIWPLRRRIRRPTVLAWTVLALLSAGRFVEFFARSDSEPLALGLVTAQWASVVLFALAVAGVVLTVAYRRSDRQEPGR
jgi:phosphatidylglycerol:prolipoprotein diacylglycerol transferase